MYNPAVSFPTVGFKVIEDRLYVAAKMRDLQSENLVGVLEYDKWSLRNSNIDDYHYDDKRLEVIDNSGNIIFSIKYNDPNSVLVQGYFIDKSAAVVIYKDGFFSVSKTDAKWKEQMLEHIKKIKSIF